MEAAQNSHFWMPVTPLDYLKFILRFQRLYAQSHKNKHIIMTNVLFWRSESSVLSTIHEHFPDLKINVFYGFSLVYYLPVLYTQSVQKAKGENEVS